MSTCRIKYLKKWQVNDQMYHFMSELMTRATEMFSHMNVTNISFVKSYRLTNILYAV